MNTFAIRPSPNRILAQSLLLALLLLLGWAIAVLPLRATLAASLLAAGGLALVRWPWLVWAGIGAALPWMSAVDIGPLSLTDVALAAAFALWFADGVRRRTLHLDGSPVLALLGIYIGVQFISLLGAPNLAEAAAEVIKWVEFGLVLLIASAMLAAPSPRIRAGGADKRAAPLAPQPWGERFTSQAKPSPASPRIGGRGADRPVRWLVAGVLIGGVSQALLGLYQFVNRIGPDWFIVLGRFMRASGTFRQPNPYAGYLGLILPVAVSLAIWSWAALLRRDTRDQIVSESHARRLHPVEQWVDWGLKLAGPLFFSGAALAIAAGLLASWSRGGWLGMLAGVGVVIVFRSRLAALLSGLALLLLLTALLLGNFRPDAVPEPVAARMQEIPAFLGMTDILSQPVTDENFAVIERLAHWVAAIRMWEMAPWFGVGPGNYATVYPLVRLPRWEDALGHAHNVYLNVLGETGLVGLTAYLALWIGVVIWVWRRFRRFPAGSYAGALTLGVLGSIAHLSVHNGFDNLYVQGIYILIALLLAAVAGERELKIEE